jgi:hypothetical protein
LASPSALRSAIGSVPLASAFRASAWRSRASLRETSGYSLRIHSQWKEKTYAIFPQPYPQKYRTLKRGLTRRFLWHFLARSRATKDVRGAALGLHKGSYLRISHRQNVRL